MVWVKIWRSGSAPDLGGEMGGAGSEVGLKHQAEIPQFIFIFYLYIYIFIVQCSLNKESCPKGGDLHFGWERGSLVTFSLCL